MAYTNNDGLYIKSGVEEARVSTGGEYRNDGPYHSVEVLIGDLTTLGTDPAIISDTTIIPKGARIDEVQIINETAATSDGSAALNVGLARLDRTTAYDVDALVKAAALSTFNSAGETVVIRAGSTAVGDLVGTTTAYPSLITADYDTAAFTAGKLVIRVIYRIPVSLA